MVVVSTQLVDKEAPQGRVTSMVVVPTQLIDVEGGSPLKSLNRFWTTTHCNTENPHCKSSISTETKTQVCEPQKPDIRFQFFLLLRVLHFEPVCRFLVDADEYGMNKITSQKNLFESG